MTSIANSTESPLPLERRGPPGRGEALLGQQPASAAPTLPVFELVLGLVLMVISQKMQAGGSIGRTLLLFVLCGASIVYGYYRDPYAPLYCYAFTTPITNAFGTTFAFILGGAFLVWRRRDVCRWKWQFSLPGLAFCLWSLAGLIWAEEIFVGLDSYIAQALAPMFLAFLVCGLRDPMFRRKLVLMVIAACAIGSLASLRNWFRGVGEMGSGGRFYSLIRPDPFSAWEIFGILSALAWLAARDTARWLRWVLIGILPLLVVGLGLCGFRAAILAALLGFIMVEICLKRLLRGLGLLLVAAVPVVAASLLVPSLFGTVLSRFATIGQDRGSDRLDIWGDAMKLFWQHPFIGYGLDNFKLIIGRLYGEDQMPHSIYVGTLVELGVIGLALMLVWFAVLLWKAWRTPERIWLFPMLVAFLLQAAFLHEFYFSCFWLAIGLVEGSRPPGVGGARWRVAKRRPIPSLAGRNPFETSGTVMRGGRA
jgi:hypothetical protein